MKKKIHGRVITHDDSYYTCTNPNPITNTEVFLLVHMAHGYVHKDGYFRIGDGDMVSMMEDVVHKSRNTSMFVGDG
jgi:hypothetical protein